MQDTTTTEPPVETGATELPPEGARTPQEQAAAEALERAQRPPEALGGPPAPTAPPARGTDPEAEVETVGAAPGLDLLERARARAEAAAQGTDVERDVLDATDEHLETRDRVLSGEAEDEDYEAITEWLLSDDQEVNTRKLRVRLGGSDENPLYAPWYIAAIGIDVIRSAEREAQGNRAQRRAAGGSGYDELKANLRIVSEATIAIGKAPHQGGLSAKQAALAHKPPIADASIWLERKFRYRPGAIAQIAGEVMALSGFDAEDVQAAGNS